MEPTSEEYQLLKDRWRTLSSMCGLCTANNEMQAAEGYLLELLAWCAFADRTTLQVPQA